MQDWQPGLYLEFEKERTQPSIDLVARIVSDDPQRILDLGCGPGNSTDVLAGRWPRAQIIGMDSSEAMISEAKANYPDRDWLLADASGDMSGLGTFDIIFSNAVIQWIPHLEILLPKLFNMLHENGVLAVQVPCTKYMPLHTELVNLAASEKWRTLFEAMDSSYSVHTADFYYETLSVLTADFELWETDYYHVMNSHADLVKWYSASGLRPYMDCLEEGLQAAGFIEDYEAALKVAYPLQSDGKLLFPATRIFFIARRCRG